MVEKSEEIIIRLVKNIEKWTREVRKSVHSIHEKFSHKNAILKRNQAEILEMKNTVWQNKKHNRVLKYLVQ